MERPLLRIEDIQTRYNSVSTIAKVIHKSDIVTAPGSISGPFYKILVGDDTGVLYVFLYLHPRPSAQVGPGDIEQFQNQMTQIADGIQVGNVYKFDGRVRRYLKEYTVATHVNECELLFDDVVEDDVVDVEFANNCHVPFLFSTAQQIHEIGVDLAVDVLGRVVSREMDTLRFIHLRMMDGEIRCNIFPDNLHLVENTKVAIQGAKTKDFDGERQLNIGNTATVYRMDTEEDQRYLDPNLADFFLNTFGEPMMQ